MTRASVLSLYIALIIASIPIGLLSLSGVVSAIADSRGMADSIRVLPYILLGITAFLGFKMHHMSIVFSALMFAGSYLVVTNPMDGIPGWAKYKALSISAPVTLALIFSVSTRRFAGRSGVALVSSLILPTGLLLLLVKYELPLVRGMLNWRVSDIDGWRVPDVAVLLLQFYGVSLFRVKDRELQRYSIVTFLCFFPLFWLLNQFIVPDKVLHAALRAGVVFSGIGTTLLYAMYRMYWQKIYIDELTEIPNRRALDATMARLHGIYTIAMLDIDHFKRFNDTYGHDEGDNALRFVAFHLARETGMKAYRYGGEEFCLIYEGKTADAVHEHVNAVRGSLAKRSFYIRAPRHIRARTTAKDRKGNPHKAPVVNITVSVGLASPNGREMSSEDVRTMADRALYRSKKKGRNRVSLWLGEDVEEFRTIKAS